MKKRIYAILMALLLSTVTLAGCGDSGSSRRDRDRYEDDDDDDGRSSSKSSSSSKKNYQSDVKTLTKVLETLTEDLDDAYTDEEIVDALNKAVKNLDVKTSEGKKIKSDISGMADICEKAIKYEEREDYDKLDDLEDDLQDLFDDVMDHVYDFCDAADSQGVDYDDLDELADLADDIFG